MENPKFEVNTAIVAKEDSEAYKNWKGHYAIIQGYADDNNTYLVLCVNAENRDRGFGGYTKSFIEDNFRVLSKAERVLYAE